MVASDRIPVDVEQIAVNHAEFVVIEMAGKIKRREFDASPEKSKCGRCDVRSICAKSANRVSK
jgi:sulfatase maturation enzyme AslB (radical SAM superfamily)